MHQDFKPKRILITGINGFIGHTITKALIGAGYDVWGVDRSSTNKQIIITNLLKSSDVFEAANKIPPFSVLIHTAAIAHNQSLFDNQTIFDDNVKMLKNVLNAFTNSDTHVIFLSSVSVYGEDKRTGVVTVKDDLRPSTFYGLSKMKCEEIIINKISNSDILRLTPVYDENHLVDVRKRIFFPFFPSLKMIITPSPLFSLCNINSVCTAVQTIISRGPNGQNIFNISDPAPYSQKEMTLYFPNRKIVIPRFITKPIYWSTYLLPKNTGYSIRCLYWKIFESNIYKNNLELSENEFNTSKTQYSLLNLLETVK
jgi:nucleoside-diphosphate-sugar epimerase